MLHILIFLIPIFLLARGDFKPKLDYTLQDRYLLHKKSPFSEFNEVEKATLWGKEYYIGTHFAKSLDLYQAITSFKRANILIPDEFLERKRQIEYQILFAYYLGKKYQDAVDVFESSLLSGVDGSFSAYHDLLVILFESYTKVEERDKAKVVLRLLDKSYPMTAKKLELSEAILTARIDDIRTLSDFAATEEEVKTLIAKQNEGSVQLAVDQGSVLPEDKITFLQDLIDCQKSTRKIAKEFLRHRKSPLLAQLLNAVIPGTGYLYLGQKQTAVTALAVNSLFIASMAYFFAKQNYPAGIIATSFEIGWYFGGILGAKENANIYNEKLYEDKAHYRLRDHRLYPALVLCYGF